MCSRNCTLKWITEWYNFTVFVIAGFTLHTGPIEGKHAVKNFLNYVCFSDVLT
jgi:hypothetical protein